MYLLPFVSLPFVSVFGEQGGKETRVFITRGQPGLPDHTYALMEA